MLELRSYEDEIIEKTLQGEEDVGCDSARVLHEDSQNSKIHSEKDDVAFLEINAQSMLRAMGCSWWKITKALNMRVDPCNHISQKHKWDRHNWSCLWRKIPSEWSGEEEWSTKKRRMPV